MALNSHARHWSQRCGASEPGCAFGVLTDSVLDVVKGKSVVQLVPDLKERAWIHVGRDLPAPVILNNFISSQVAIFYDIYMKEPHLLTGIAICLRNMAEPGSKMCIKGGLRDKPLGDELARAVSVVVGGGAEVRDQPAPVWHTASSVSATLPIFNDWMDEHTCDVTRS